MSGFDNSWSHAARRICGQLGDAFVLWELVEPYADAHPGAPAPYPALRDGIHFGRAWLVAEVTRSFLDTDPANGRLEDIRDQYVGAQFAERDWRIVVDAANSCLKK